MIIENKKFYLKNFLYVLTQRFPKLHYIAYFIALYINNL